MTQWPTKKALKRAAFAIATIFNTAAHANELDLTPIVDSTYDNGIFKL